MRLIRTTLIGRLHTSCQVVVQPMVVSYCCFSVYHMYHMAR